MILILFQTLLASLLLGLPVYALLHLAWMTVHGRIAQAIDLVFVLKDCLQDRR